MLEEALRLRYEIFNLELSEGLADAHLSGLDEDQFDAVCDHLIVREEATGLVVGTYRMQTGLMAAKNYGYYSAREFDFTPYEPLRDSLVELGRACVHKDHRNISVISLLWRKIVKYVARKNARYMIGCSSLNSQDEALGVAMYRRFQREGSLASPEFLTRPMPEFSLAESDSFMEPRECPPPPKLLRAYLGVGAKICGEPAIDREFKTIDFLTLMDGLNATPSATERFQERSKREPSDS